MSAADTGAGVAAPAEGTAGGPAPEAPDTPDAPDAPDSPDAPDRAGATGDRGESARNWSRMVASGPPAATRRIRMRLLRSELGMVFRRRRNQVALLVLAAVPILIGVAVRVSSPGRNGSGDGPPFFDQITHNGIFVAFSALTAVIALFLPLSVSVVAGDAVAGEGSLGTLRYLLVVPVARSRVLAVKYAGTVAFGIVATAVVAFVGAVIGIILFGAGSATLLSGTQVGFGVTLWRLLLVTLYVAAAMAAVAAIGLFMSTLVEAPMAATAATAGICIASAILDQVPQLHAIQPYLPSHYWTAFGDLLRDPIATDVLSKGLLSIAVYAVLFYAMSWARFGEKDVTS